MPRTEAVRRAFRALRLAQHANHHRISTREALERRDAARARQISRRDFVRTAGLAIAAASPVGGTARAIAAAPRIAIVGAGLAGLACADRLQTKGYSCVVYEGASRIGGRCFSNRSLVPGMACENGGELIDTGHKTMLGYANEFNLRLESYIRKAGEESFYFLGQHWSEEDVIDQFRAAVASIQRDLHAISGAATFYEHTPVDVALDNTDLASYFATRLSATPLVHAVLNEAYLAEYGRETREQSTLNFLGFMRLNKQSKFEPFGVSDERYHLRDGNDGIVQGLAAKLRSPILTGARLTRLGRTQTGRIALYFNGSASAELADAVVLAIPFTVLRQVQLDPSLGLSADKKRAIAMLGYGLNAKTMVAFAGRPWEELYGANGGAYSDLPNVQTTWETNRGQSKQFGIITDYASGDRAVTLHPDQLQTQVDSFLADYDVIFPGTQTRAARHSGKYVAHLEQWILNPFSLGSYTCYTPGQFTSIAGLEGEASGPLKFAGEHTDSFYSWQGFMEGACLSGIRAANEVLADIKAGTLQARYTRMSNSNLLSI